MATLAGERQAILPADKLRANRDGDVLAGPASNIHRQMVATLKPLQIVLSILYWVVAAFLLWHGYIGDAAIDAASTTPVTHSPAFDTFAAFVVVAIVYGVACGVWWAIAAMKRRSAAPNG